MYVKNTKKSGHLNFKLPIRSKVLTERLNFHKFFTRKSCRQSGSRVKNSILSKLQNVFEGRKRESRRREGLKCGFHFKKSYFSQEKQLRRIIPHPSYDFRTKLHDIALIEVHGDIVLSAYVRRACVPPHYPPYKPYTSWGPQLGTQCYVAGWGETAGEEIAFFAVFLDTDLVFFLCLK